MNMLSNKDIVFGMICGGLATLLLIILILLFSEFIAWLAVRKTKQKPHQPPVSQGGPNVQSWRR